MSAYRDKVVLYRWVKGHYTKDVNDQVNALQVEGWAVSNWILQGDVLAVALTKVGEK